MALRKEVVRMKLSSLPDNLFKKEPRQRLLSLNRRHNCYQLFADERSVCSGIEDVDDGDNFYDFAKDYYNLLEEENFFDNF